MRPIKELSILFMSFFALAVAKPASAQLDTSKSCSGESCCITECLSKGSFSAEGFGGPLAGLTATGLGVNPSIGGGGGLLFDCGLYVGAFNKWSSISKPAPGYNGEEYNGEEVELESGYGGLMIGGHPFKNKVVHPKWGLQVGYGSIEGTIEEYVDGTYDMTVMEEDLFVIKPDIGVGINVCSSLLLDISTGYRFVKGMEGIDKLGLGAHELNGFQGSVGLKFTGF